MYTAWDVKIVEDFDDFVKHTEPGFFQKDFNDAKKSASFPEEGLICAEIVTRNMELALAELKNHHVCYMDDFDELKKKILEGTDAEEKADEWLDELPCNLYTFYHTVIDLLWRANWKRYTTALRDTGKASPRSEN